MKVARINITYPQLNFAANNRANDNAVRYNSKKNNVNPLKESITTAGIWFAFGVCLDFLSRKISFFKSPTKNSFAINGLIALVAGIATACKSVSRNNNIS